MGAVAPDKVAHLVVLDADPLQDIYKTTRIAALAVRGVLLDRTKRDAILVASSIPGGADAAAGVDIRAVSGAGMRMTTPAVRSTATVAGSARGLPPRHFW